jgi:hypothetical protein
MRFKRVENFYGSSHNTNNIQSSTGYKETRFIFVNIPYLAHDVRLKNVGFNIQCRNRAGQKLMPQISIYYPHLSV